MALSLIAAGGSILALSALSEPAGAYVGAFAGMALIGLGAALSHPQLSGAVIALAPPEVSGMASALTVVARQAGFALGVATLGALTPLRSMSALSSGPSELQLRQRQVASSPAFCCPPERSSAADPDMDRSSGCRTRKISLWDGVRQRSGWLLATPSRRSDHPWPFSKAAVRPPPGTACQTGNLNLSAS